MGRGNESLFVGSGSHDQDGHHAHIWLKCFQNLLLQNQWANDLVVCSNVGPRLTLTYFTAW